MKRTATGKWFVSISVESEQGGAGLPPSDEQVGIDVGLKTFAYLSNARKSYFGWAPVLAQSGSILDRAKLTGGEADALPRRFPGDPPA